MRTSWVISIVIAAHVAVGALLFQGCGTLKRISAPAPAESARMPEVPVEPPKLVTPPPPMVEESKEPRMASPETTTYTVQKGDSLSLICKRHHLKNAEVMAMNGIKDPNKIRLGQKLILPGKLDVPAAAPAKKSAAKKRVGVKLTSTAAAAPTAAGGAYVVKAGDSLSKIAARHGVKTAELRQANNLSGDMIRVGQKLVIPGKGAEKAAALKVETAAPLGVPAAAPEAPAGKPVEAAPEAAPVGDLKPVGAAPAEAPAAPATAVREHTADKGEDLYTVAMMYGVDVSELKKINGLTDTALTPGQRLKVPVTQ